MKGGWILLGFTTNFAIELSEFRSILELNAVQQVLACPIDHGIWGAVEVVIDPALIVLNERQATPPRLA